MGNSIGKLSTRTIEVFGERKAKVVASDEAWKAYLDNPTTESLKALLTHASEVNGLTPPQLGAIDGDKFPLKLTLKDGRTIEIPVTRAVFAESRERLMHGDTAGAYQVVFRGDLANQEEKKKIASTFFFESFGTNLTQEARRGKLSPVIGREKEIDQAIVALSRKSKNCPVILGEAGVGKTAVVEGLAQRIVRGEVPSTLQGKEIFALDLGSLMAGARFRGDFEERLKNIVKEVSRRDDIILFIDELHGLVGLGDKKGEQDAANLLKPFLGRGELPIIGATTLDEYRKHIEKDAALARRFQPIVVEAPSVPETVEMLRGLRSKQERVHGTQITDDALSAAAKLAKRYLTDRQLPDSAFDLVDEASAKEFLTGGYLVDVPQIQALVAEMKGMPEALLEDPEKKALHAEEHLGRRVFGQLEARNALGRAVRRRAAGISDLSRPDSFIFAGPTGVGKTELAKSLAEFLYGDEDAMIRLDMSEFAEKHTVSRLFGAAPGLVGYEEGGELTNQVRRRPFSVILLDEVEKAHPTVFDPLLQVLEEGKLTDGAGNVVDFSNVTIVMTTNLGSGQAARSSVGFGADGAIPDSKSNKAKVLSALESHFRAEFLNRVTEKVVFDSLSRDDMLAAVDKYVAQMNEKLEPKQLEVSFSDRAREHFAKKGYDPAMGARPLRRLLEHEVEGSLADLLLFGELRRGDQVHVDVDAHGNLDIARAEEG